MNEVPNDFDGKTLERIMNEAIKEAIERHLKLGVPVVYLRDGKIRYLMPDGTEVSKEELPQNDTRASNK